ncbi:hypothetical protein SUGI_0944320 [Cryptomeria japonica]|nr:hypothetical protein SUGI_0944320 [Cryptomeria japonica]
MARSSSCWVMKMTFMILLISIAIMFNVESVEGRRILKRKSVQDKFSAQLSVVKEENSGLEVLRNKLPGGPSPGTGNAFINNGGVKSSWRTENIFKNKLPGGPSPGTGNAYINDGGVKSGRGSVSILKNKLSSGPSPGTGNSYINDGGIKITTLLKNKLPGGPSPGSGNAFINDGGVKSGLETRKHTHE